MASEARWLDMLPFQVLTDEGQIIIKRGSVTIGMIGERSGVALQSIIEQFSHGPINEADILSRGEYTPFSDLSIILKKFLDWRLIIPVNSALRAPENRTDIHYWHFQKSEAEVHQSYEETDWIVAGVNGLSRSICKMLDRRGAKKITVVDYYLFRNQQYFDPAGDILHSMWEDTLPIPISLPKFLDSFTELHTLILTSDFGGGDSFRVWNKLCIDRNWRFLPVLIDGWTAFIGPYVDSPRTPCFECVRARENSNLDNPRLLRLADRNAFVGQESSALAPGILQIVSGVVEAEIERHIINILPRWPRSTQIVFDWRDLVMNHHHILRLPVCKECGIKN